MGETVPILRSVFFHEYFIEIAGVLIPHKSSGIFGNRCIVKQVSF